MKQVSGKMKSDRNGAVYATPTLTSSAINGGDRFMAFDSISKLCPTCKQTLPANHFYKNRSKPDGLSTQCKPCANVSNAPAVARSNKRRKLRINYKAENKRYALKAKYGITVEQYEDLVAAQRGRCAVCDKVPRHVLNVDHCHETGRVRGLLCAKCNQALGVFGDSVEGLQKAIAYLQGGRRGDY